MTTVDSILKRIDELETYLATCKPGQFEHNYAQGMLRALRVQQDAFAQSHHQLSAALVHWRVDRLMLRDAIQQEVGGYHRVCDDIARALGVKDES